MSFSRLDEKFSSLFGDDGIFVDILGENVIIIVGDVVGGYLNNCGSGRFGDILLIIATGRGMVFNRRRRHDDGIQTALMG